MTAAAASGPPPVLRSAHVARPLDETFEVFTRQIGAWWPLPTHGLFGPDAGGLGFEDGHLVERAVDGRTCVWGEVLAWEPPHRVVVSWHPGQEAAAASEIEVRFTASEAGGTRVELEHRGWERFGDSAMRRRHGYVGPGAWGHVLDHFADVADARPDAIDLSVLAAAYDEFFTEAERGGFGDPPAGQWDAERVVAHVALNDLAMTAVAQALVHGRADLTFTNTTCQEPQVLAGWVDVAGGLPGLVTRGRALAEVSMAASARLDPDQLATEVPCRLFHDGHLVLDAPMPWGRLAVDTQAGVHLAAHTGQLRDLRSESLLRLEATPPRRNADGRVRSAGGSTVRWPGSRGRAPGQRRWGATMRVEHVRAFVVLAEELNFRRAAARLFVSQPTLTAQLHQLERDLGVTLFDRGPGGSRADRAGAELLPAAREVLGAVDELSHRAGAGPPPRRRRRVRVGLGPDGIGAATWLAVQAFAAARPDLELSVTPLVFSTVLPAFDRGDVDALLLHGPVDELGSRRVVTVGTVPVGALVPRHHWLADRRTVDLHEVVPYIRAVPPREMGEAFIRFWYPPHPERAAPVGTVSEQARTGSPRPRGRGWSGCGRPTSRCHRQAGPWSGRCRHGCGHRSRSSCAMGGRWPTTSSGRASPVRVVPPSVQAPGDHET